MTKDEYKTLAEDIDTWTPEKVEIFIDELQNLMSPDEFRAFQAEIKRHDHESLNNIRRAPITLDVIYLAFWAIVAVISTIVLLHIAIK